MQRRVLYVVAALAVCVAAVLILRHEAGVKEGRPGGTAPTTATQEFHPVREGPCLSVRPKIFDVGKVHEGDTLTRTFVLCNEGTYPLEIAKVEPRCKTCIETELKRREIPPGESEDLVVSYELTDTVGDFVRYIAIESNDPADPSISVILQGRIVPEFSADPSRLAFGEVLATEGASAEVAVTRNFGGAFELTGVPPTPPGLKVELPERQVLPAGAPFRVGVSLLPGLPYGPLERKIVLPVNGRLRDRIIVKVTADIVNPVRSAAREVFFGMVPRGNTATESIPLILAEGLKAGDLRAESDADYVRMEVVRLGSQSGAQLKVTLLPVVKGGPFATKVRLKTVSNPDETAFEIDCYGIRSE